MKQRIRKILCLGLAGSLVFACAACGSEEQTDENVSTETDGSSAAAETETEEIASSGLSFAGDIVGQGATALDIFVEEMEYDFEMLGADFQIYNDNFTADTQMQNIETMASTGYDGIMVYGWNATAYSSISDIYSTAQIPFVIFDQIPREEESVDLLTENEYYVGAVGTDSYAEGVNAAKAMLDDGITTAIILGGSVGDSIHDTRVEGFTAAFEEGGGSVLGSGRCSDATEGTTKFDDLLSAYGDVQGAYCLSGDYAIAAISAMDNHADSDVKLYVAGATTETLSYIEDGTIAWADSGSKLVIPIAAALLMNYAQGNIILDDEGNAPYFDTVVPFEVTAENADQFSELFLTGHPLEQDEIATLVGADVTYQDFVDFIESYSMD